MTTKFKVGDRVKYTGSFSGDLVGKAGTVKNTIGEHTVVVDWGNDMYRGVYPSSISLIPVTFKLGDRVRMTKEVDGYIFDGVAKIALVLDGQHQPYGLEFPDFHRKRHSCSSGIKFGYGYWVGADSIELVTESADDAFKIGDRVVSIDAPEAGVGRVIAILPSGNFKVKFPSWHGLCTESATSIKLAPASRPAIVARMCGSRPAPSPRPFVHPTTDAAVTEAERLSVANPGVEFAVYELVARSSAPVPPKPVATTERV
jgi:hypothetical protein